MPATSKRKQAKTRAGRPIDQKKRAAIARDLLALLESLLQSHHPPGFAVRPGTRLVIGRDTKNYAKDDPPPPTAKQLAPIAAANHASVKTVRRVLDDLLTVAKYNKSSTIKTSFAPRARVAFDALVVAALAELEDEARAVREQAPIGRTAGHK